METIGVPREVKPFERRVALTPAAVAELGRSGARVLIEHAAGAGSGYRDDDYVSAGARVADRAEVFGASSVLVKVKEPQPEEVELLQAGQLLFTYLHLAADLRLAQAVAATGVTAVAYENVVGVDGDLPLLTPMSEIAGRLAPQAAARALEAQGGGRGVLLGPVPGVPPAHVIVVGAGVCGQQAAAVALGMGAEVSLFDIRVDALRRAAQRLSGMLRCELATRDALLGRLPTADAVIGAVLVPGDRAPRVLLHDDLDTMRPGAVLVDVAIDQGGCFETSRPTTHDEPTFVERDVVHYCVANMPAAVPRTATQALVNATLPHVRRFAQGAHDALRERSDLADAVVARDGELIDERLAVLVARQPVAA